MKTLSTFCALFLTLSACNTAPSTQSAAIKPTGDAQIQVNDAPPTKVDVEFDLETAIKKFNYPPDVYGSVSFEDQEELDYIEESSSYDDLGINAVAVALVNSHQRDKEPLDEETRKAWDSTVNETYAAWQAVEAGTDTLAVPEWTAVVMQRAKEKNWQIQKVEDAIRNHARAERRIARLKDPSWTDSLVRWWNRPK